MGVKVIYAHQRLRQAKEACSSVIRTIDLMSLMCWKQWLAICIV